MAEKLTAAQRAANFAMMTRQNKQMIPQQTTTQEASTLQFSLPKARLLSKVKMLVTGQIKLTGTGTNGAEPEDVYKIIRRVSMDMNNGFSPFVVSGKELAMYNKIDQNGSIYQDGNYVRINGANGGYLISSSGVLNIFSFCLDLPVTLNDRDPIGLILLQNEQTQVNVTVDVGTAAECYKHISTISAATLVSLSVSLMTETFSVPANSNAYPDLSVLKLVNGRHDSLPASGQNIVKLSTGTIYRKIIFQIFDNEGNPVEDDDVLSTIDLVFNQADVNYAVSAAMLRYDNFKQLGFPLPKGMFFFDFSYQGITNMGGSRDYIDTERLTEFWLRFNTATSGTVEIVTECLARLQ